MGGLLTTMTTTGLLRYPGNRISIVCGLGNIYCHIQVTEHLHGSYGLQWEFDIGLAMHTLSPETYKKLRSNPGIVRLVWNICQAFCISKTLHWARIYLLSSCDCWLRTLVNFSHISTKTSVLDLFRLEQAGEFECVCVWGSWYIIIKCGHLSVARSWE